MGNQGFHARRLAENQNNPREVAFAERWEYENEGGACDPITDLLIPDCTDRDRQVAATVIQWLGSNVGMSFLHEVLKKSPEVKRWFAYSLTTQGKG